MLEKILSLHRIYKQLIVILYDLTISFFSIFLGYLFVSNFNDLNFQEILNLTFISVVCFISIFYLMGLYSSIFRYIDFNSLIKILISLLLYFVLINIFIKISLLSINYEIIYIHILLFSIGIIFGRFLIIEITIILNNSLNKNEKNNDKILIYGAGEAGFKVSKIITR